MRIVKKTDGVDYIRDFVGLIQLKNVRMTDVVNEIEPHFCLRHDVDHSLDMALAMAEVEAKNNLTSTYFLLPTGSYNEQRNYYGHIEDGVIIHSPDLIDKCHRIIDMGHHIGFHNDSVAMSLKLKMNPYDFIAREVDFFDKHNIKLRGTAAHGSPLARQLKFNNREIFSGCIRKGWEPGRTLEYNGWQVELHSLKLEDFGFEYEAYSLPRDSRISESGGRWGGRIAGYQIDRDQLNSNFNIEEFRSIISRLHPNADVHAMQVMTHPEHWKVEE